MTCQVCGCTDTRACEGGCFWVYPTLCSRCVLDAVREAALALAPADRHQFVGQLLVLAGELRVPVEQLVPSIDPMVAAFLNHGGAVMNAGSDEDGRLTLTPWRPGDPT